ncbi:14155_t:CDS:2 [Funneliformis geosporum]|uniref:14155_t:CDS:1 n=1 Tax=Funneliformis geosporum TaxID=1117311 RepID=A0A9W4STW9_9GLOM|nr:14155_t:CDS:2 [Funneliformis geosporum]
MNHVPPIIDLYAPDGTSYLTTETPSYGYKNYSEFIPGGLPLILSISHGGHLFPKEIPDRKKMIPGMVKSNDINTQEIGHLLSQRITKKFNGRKPYMVINHLGRSKIDVNRPLKEGIEIQMSNETDIVWNDYHNFMKRAVDEVELRFERGLLIDIHGHGHSENYIELGYAVSLESLLISTNELNTNNEIVSGSSIRALCARKHNELSFSEILRGEFTSLGGKLQDLGYDTIPSHVHKYPLPIERYFHGGYSVQRYGSRNNEHVVDAIQLELPRLLRLGNRRLREKSVKDLAEALSKGEASGVLKCGSSGNSSLFSVVVNIQVSSPSISYTSGSSSKGSGTFSISCLLFFSFGECLVSDLALLTVVGIEVVKEERMKRIKKRVRYRQYGGMTKTRKGTIADYELQAGKCKEFLPIGAQVTLRACLCSSPTSRPDKNTDDPTSLSDVKVVDGKHADLLVMMWRTGEEIFVGEQAGPPSQPDLTKLAMDSFKLYREM